MSLSADFPKIVVDQSAETKNELLEDWPLGDKSFERFIKKKVDDGEWERVAKRVNGRITPAYRRKKK